MTNRREYPRHEIDWPIFLRTGVGTRRVGELVNISLGGVLMSFSENLDRKERSHFDLFVCRPHHSTELLEIEGQAVWINETGDGDVIGLKLAELGEAERDTLRGFIEHREELAIQLDLEE